jgi:hypothetical protein
VPDIPPAGADQPAASPSSRVPQLIGRLGLYTTYGAAALFLLVIAGDLAVLVRHAPVVGWLALLIGMGPLVALLLSTVASYVNYYGVWRVLRGQDEFDAGQDLKSHAADLPQAAQALLAGRAGCLPAAATGLLFLSLVLVLTTSLPPQTPFLGALATWTGHQPESALSAAPTATPTPTVAPSPMATPTATPTLVLSAPAIPTATPTTPVPTPTPTPIPPVINFSISPTQANWSCPSQGLQPAAQNVTLDNSGSNVHVTWQASAGEADGASNYWAVITPASGDVPAAGTQVVTISPNPASPSAELCRSSSPNGTAWHVTIVANGAGTYTFTYFVIG